ncbi:MAG: SLBB domain-containing protein [Candidatus Zixiibacteriota bacterium]
MRKGLLFSVFIIILIAVSWFSPARCQVPNNEELRQKYYELDKQKVASEENYDSPEIFGEMPKAVEPVSADVKNNGDDYDTELTGSSISEKRLLPFGYDLFSSPSELTPPSDVADLSGYILGPGDNIIIYLWGKVEKQYNLTVDRQGKIFIPKIGEMIVWGLSLEEFESKCTKKLSQAYSDFKASVSLGKIRSIRIYMTGEVKKPGAYTVSSLTTMFNALYLAGGPNLRGTMREIKVLRNNEVIKTVDMYDFLLKGESQDDIRLASGDAIFIPVTGPRVTISGEIKRPGIYELRGGEKVSELIALAGGGTASAFMDRIMLDRISPNDEREVVDLNLGSESIAENDLILKDDDIITIYSIYEMRRNIVSIAGQVKHPGYFERNDSTTLKSIIEQSELLPENVYMARANLFRYHSDGRAEIIPIALKDIVAGNYDLSLQDKDSIYIYAIDEIERKNYVHISGEIKKPGKYSLFDNMTIKDLIFLAGNFNKEAFLSNVELARADLMGNTSIINIDLSNPIQAELELQEDDHIFVRRTPDWFKNRLVTIEGEVRFPGQYALMSKNETLMSMIKRAGGFTNDAFPRGTIFQRHSISEALQRQNLSQIISNSQPIKEDSLGNLRKVELLRFNPEDMNRIVIDMDRVIETDGKIGDIILQTDDYIFVPEIPSGISVMGAVGSNGTIKFESKRNVNYYIKRAGNFNSQADKKQTRLIKADGRVFAGSGTRNQVVEIGDAIVVPTEIKKEGNFMKTLTGTLSVIGGIATTVLIIGKL